MSAPVSGDFSCSDLLVIQARAEQIFADDVRRPDYVAHVDAALAVMNNQTARFSMLQNPEKDREVQVMWLADCDEDEPEDCGDDCDFTGNEVGSQCQTYAMTECFEKKFSVAETDMRTNVFDPEEVIAIQMLKKLKLMDEMWARKIIAKLDLWKGVNEFPQEFVYDSGETYIPAASWNGDLFAAISMMMIQNQLSNSFLLSGSNLYRANWKAVMESGNANGSGEDMKFKTFPMYFDLFNLDSTLGAKKTFIVNPNSLAVVTKAYNPESPMDFKFKNGNQIRYKVASPNLPGIEYDVYYAYRCENNKTYHDYMIRSKGGIFHNPLGCNDGRTGILSLLCGNAPD